MEDQTAFKRLRITVQPPVRGLGKPRFGCRTKLLGGARITATVFEIRPLQINLQIPRRRFDILGMNRPGIIASARFFQKFGI